MNVRMLVDFVIMFSMYRLYGEQRSFEKKSVNSSPTSKASDTS